MIRKVFWIEIPNLKVVLENNLNIIHPKLKRLVSKNKVGLPCWFSKNEPVNEPHKDALLVILGIGSLVKAPGELCALVLDPSRPQAEKKLTSELFDGLVTAATVKHQALSRTGAIKPQLIPHSRGPQ